MHHSTYVLTIVLQQMHHQLPKEPLPLGTRQEYAHSVIYYHGDCIEKQVDFRSFEAGDSSTLLRVYEELLQLPNGANISHPVGLIRPLGMPTFVRDRWKVEVPLGWPRKPCDLDSLRQLVKDFCQSSPVHAGFRV